jgi:hypothetical protein
MLNVSLKTGIKPVLFQGDFLKIKNLRVFYAPKLLS